MTICTPWRAAASLNVLLEQINALAPKRSKASDGSIGDPAHQAEQCSSQHNSCCVKLNGVWIIRARDFTHDPGGGFDSYAFAEQLRLARDPRIRYIISNRRITGPNYGWVWHAYSGDDPHTNHAHVSVVDVAALFDSTAAWNLGTLGAALVPTIKEMTLDLFLATDNAGRYFVCNGIHSREFPAAQLKNMEYLVKQLGVQPRSGPEWLENGYLRKDWSEELFGALVKPQAAVAGPSAADVAAQLIAQLGGGK